jgi:hypothetical protein
MADRGVFQMDQAKPADKKTMRAFGERGQNTVMDSHKHLPDRGILETSDQKSIFRL